MDGSADLTSSSQSHRRVVRMTDGTLLNRFYDDIPKPRPEAFYEDYHTAHSSTSERNESDIYVNIRAAAESGWDFSSRWLVNAGDLSTIYTTDIIPVDLNCLMFNLERVLASAYEKKFDRSMSQHYRQLAQKRKTAIQTYFWSKEHDYFMDYDFRLNQPTKSMTLAGVYPLWTELATEEQASAVMDKIERLFLKDGGLVTTINEKSHQQWDFPNGWAPLQYITYKGILNYSPRSPLVKKIIDQWMMLNEKVFNETRKMVEKYDVVNTNAEAGGGEYKTQDGFGWTNGVYLEMLKDRKNLMRKSHF
ncbi:unnamed protein product [Didymodactylos carnosus]|nr:unnamed protein product [Didymodactylos carnosus]CAF4301698.1 unnamed protein product [Didymodactylos carnosus]